MKEFTCSYTTKDKIFIGGNTCSSDEIELIMDSNDKNYLVGFRIRVQEEQEHKAKMLAELKARRLCNLLTFKSNTITEYNAPTISCIEDNTVTIFNTISQTVSVYAGYDLNLNDDTLRSLIDCDMQINQHLYNYQNGLKAFQEKDFSIAIKEFFIIIENQNLYDIKKYRSLRHAVSHEKLNDPNTISELNKIGILIKKGDYLDTSNSNIEKILEQETRNLLNIVKPFVENELEKMSKVKFKNWKK